MAVNKVIEILNEREKVYGDFREVAKISQICKMAMRKSLSRRDRWLGARKQEALDMISSKLARIVCGNPEHLDSWVDIAGYGRLVLDEMPRGNNPDDEYGFGPEPNPKIFYKFKDVIKMSIPRDSSLFDEAGYLLPHVDRIIDHLACIIREDSVADYWLALIRSAEETAKLIAASGGIAATATHET